MMNIESFYTKQYAPVFDRKILAPKQKDALFMLLRIKNVMESRLKKENAELDLPGLEEWRFVVLQTAAEIYENYQKKYERSTGCLKKTKILFLKKKAVDHVYARIISFKKQASLLDLHSDPLGIVLDFLPLKQLVRFSQVSKKAYTEASKAIQRRARNLGCIEDSMQAARQHLCVLMKGVSPWLQKLPRSYVSYCPDNKNAVDQESTVQKWRQLLLCEDKKNALEGLYRYLFAAVGFEEPSLLHSLFRLGFNPNKVNEEGKSYLHIAVEKNRLQVVEILLWHRADVHSVDKRGYALLHLASSHVIVNLLLQHGADPNVACPRGLTPLHYAIIMQQYDIVRLLLKGGARVNAVDAKGRTPLWHAVQILHADSEKQLQIILFLLKKGGVYHVESREGLVQT